MTALPPEVRRDLDEAARMVDGLRASPAAEPLDDLLYRDWYLRRPDLETPGPEPPPLLAMNLVGALQAAHDGDRRWDEGWTVERVSNRGRVAVARDGGQRVLDRIDVVPHDAARAGLPLRPGDAVRVTARVDGISSDGGFWVTCGEGWQDQPGGTCVRFYWDVGCGGAPELVARITRELGGAGIPFLFKVPVDAAGYWRADAAVLYLAGQGVDAATPLLRRVHGAVAAQLRPPTPRLAFRLAPGVAAAEDPPTGESFGQHRCRLVAEAAAGSDGAASLVERIVDRFALDGIDPARPYANPGSTRVLVPWE